MRTPLSAVDFVSQEVRRRIWAGELRGGERLNQGELADSLGVSRIPVREALIGLERDGLVEIVPRKGARVVAMSETDVADHYELYGLIDGFALAKTLQRGDDAALTELARLADDIVATDGPEPLQKLVTDFRDILRNIGGSPRLAAVAAGLRGIVDGNYFEAVPGSVQTTHEGYGPLGDAVRSRDSDAAVAAYRETMNRQGENVIAVMRERGILADS